MGAGYKAFARKVETGFLGRNATKKTSGGAAASGADKSRESPGLRRK
jgi:hypothetical protein